MTGTSVDVSDLADAGEDERLRIARTIRRYPRSDAVAPLRAALARERVHWVRVALQEAIGQCERAANAEQPLVEPDVEVRADVRQAYSDGRRDGLRQALHEVSPILGLARDAAESSLAQASEVRVQLDRMRAVTSALRQLVSASAPSERQDFDLANVLMTLKNSPPTPCREGVIGTRGDTPFVINGDRDLVELAVRPLLTNAIEAVLSVMATPPPRSIMLSYGLEHLAYYVAVIDSGPGVSGTSELFAAGVSTKRDHFGLGLETSRTAIESLGGSLTLGGNRQGGATAILRWPTRA